ncbi:MAG TPA: hypothetical protein EYO94_12315 [Acidobacteria bacterium]|nr:hypothetical protein [Acidobacteriota bacterium]
MMELKVHARLCVAMILIVGLSGSLVGQERWSRGQNIQPVFEGWERNNDGSFSMVFGYLNRNYEEEPVIATGASNSISPGPADQGQPTHFYPRRQQFVFKVQVPTDWGEKDLVWAVTHNGRTDYAYGHLLPVWEMDGGVMRLNRGSGSGEGYADNQHPFVSVDDGSDALEVTLPNSLEIAVIAGDDGVPPPNPRLAERNPRRGPKSQAIVDPRNAATTGLAVTWLHWRGPGQVTFAPQVPEIGEGGRAVTTVSFTEPGTYVLQAVADDTVYVTSTNVTVTVHPAP